MYSLPDNYITREKPDYFADVQSDGKRWQPDVIPIAAQIARLNGLKTLVDVGCGNGDKLAPYAGEFQIVGVDYGQNLELARLHNFGQWFECDFETSTPLLAPHVLKNAVVICADVIEHLVNPMALVLGLKLMTTCAPFVLLSTPDRERTYGGEQKGPPGNPHHTREWTLAELTGWLEAFELPMIWRGWTMSNDVDRQKHTSLVILSRGNLSYNKEVGFERVFEVEAA